jgi:hypothetical protein
MYKINQPVVTDIYNICIIESNTYIPVDPANLDYQKVLDDIIEQGTDCFEGDIHEDLQEAADAKLFAKQLADYTISKERLEQYVLSVGRAEVTESLPTGEQVWNEETMEMDDVMADFITVTAIDPVDTTVEVTTYNIDTDTSSTETITNPLITTDVSERSDAQAIVDATPSAVVDAYNAL